MPTATQVVIYIVAAIAAIGVIAVIVWLVRKWLRGHAGKKSASVTPATRHLLQSAEIDIDQLDDLRPSTVGGAWAPHKSALPPLEHGSLTALHKKDVAASLPSQPEVEISNAMLNTPTRPRAGAFDFGSRLKELFSHTTSDQRRTARKILLDDARDESMCADLMDTVERGMSDSYGLMLGQSPAAAKSMCKDFAQMILDADA